MEFIKKILIIDSYRSDMAKRLERLIRSRNAYEVHIKGWDYDAAHSYDMVLPIIKYMRIQKNNLLQNLDNRYGGETIVPVICETDPYFFQMLALLENRFSKCIVYPFREKEILSRIEMSLNKSDFDEVDDAKRRITEKWALRKFVGTSRAFLEIVNKIPIVAGSDVNVLIQGETGTGKELFARAIHYQSPRRSGPFIPVNSATLPATLFENEMFGHEKEAFTDAKTFQTGIIKEAEKGTIFLDEINSIEMASQAKLLRFLEEKTYKPLGSGKKILADVRIISACNTDLESDVKTNKFRQDLFYRLNVITLTLPPLKERQEDIPLLANHFLKKYAPRFGVKRLSPEAMKSLCLHTWPGNIRELENVIQQVMIMSPRSDIDPESLQFETKEMPHDQGQDTFQEAKRKTVTFFEKEYLSKILTLYNGNISQAAKAAGKDRSEFGRLVKKHRLSRHDFKIS